MASPLLLLSGGGERRPRLRRAASLSLLGALLLLYASDVFDDAARPEPSSFEAAAARRALAYGASSSGISVRASPPSSDEVAGEYVVKPHVGNAADDELEVRSEARLSPRNAWASSRFDDGYRAEDERTVFGANNVLYDGGTYWASDPDDDPGEDQWVTIDLGLPSSLWKVYVEWGEEYAVDYEIQVAREGGGWTTAATASGKGDDEPTWDVLSDDDDHSLQGARYVRIRLLTRAPGASVFSIHRAKVFRKRMIVGEDGAGTSCGATLAAATSGLLGTHGGTLIQAYEHAEFFHASMTAAQADAMSGDACVFAVEPNYVVRARGRTRGRASARLGGSAPGIEGEGGEHRNLAIPEFNRIDEDPANWGLERISSMGARNGRYKWIHDGYATDIYVLDTGVYPDHDDFVKDYDRSSRLGAAVICEGTATDYESTSHGTHVASLAGGKHHGTGKSATIHPVQVLDATGTGTTASVLCGLDRVLGDGKAFAAANGPDKKLRAVVNLSLGADGRSDALDRAVRDVTDAGYTVVIAAGNEDDNACFYSPYDHTAITVGALRDAANGRNDKTSASNYGECVDVWAPGEDIVGAGHEGEYDSVEMSGTSVASAFVSGAASLFFEDVNTELYDADELAATVKEKLMNKAEIGILGSVGHGSANKVVQTTASRCTTNAHCDVGLRCLDDGLCWSTGRPLSELRFRAGGRGRGN